MKSYCKCVSKPVHFSSLRKEIVVLKTRKHLVVYSDTKFIVSVYADVNKFYIEILSVGSTNLNYFESNSILCLKKLIAHTTGDANALDDVTERRLMNFLNSSKCTYNLA